MSLSQEQEDISAEDEVEDSFTDEEEDLGAVEEERSVILHLLSQLKLGMDLTRVGRVPPKATAIQPPQHHQRFQQLSLIVHHDLNCSNLGEHFRILWQ